MNRNNLWFASHRVPYCCIPHDQTQAGYFCIFTDGFLRPANGGLVLHKLPVFQPGGGPVVPLVNDKYAAIKVIFKKKTQQVASGYTHKYDLLSAYLLELIHRVQERQPALALTPWLIRPRPGWRPDLPTHWNSNSL